MQIKSKRVGFEPSRHGWGFLGLLISGFYPKINFQTLQMQMNYYNYGIISLASS